MTEIIASVIGLTYMTYDGHSHSASYGRQGIQNIPYIVPFEVNGVVNLVYV